MKRKRRTEGQPQGIGQETKTQGGKMMECGRVGNNEVAACPYCDKLYHYKVPAGQVGCGDALDRIAAMHELHMTESPECRREKESRGTVDEQLASLREGLDEAESDQKASLADNPDNGRSGWWRVSGIRHEAITRASSASEAVEKCIEDGAVGRWEFPDASFMSEDLPDVISC